MTKISEQTPEKPDYWSSCGQCEHNSSNAENLLELPDLATPVLNKYRAEGIRFGARVIELYDDATMKDGHMLDSTECATVLDTLADELENSDA